MYTVKLYHCFYFTNLHNETYLMTFWLKLFNPRGKKDVFFAWSLLYINLHNQYLTPPHPHYISSAFDIHFNWGHSCCSQTIIPVLILKFKQLFQMCYKLISPTTDWVKKTTENWKKYRAYNQWGLCADSLQHFIFTKHSSSNQFLYFVYFMMLWLLAMH